MANPYHGRPDYTFWKEGVAASAAVDPVVRPIFSITRDDVIATAGSCFAQHIAKTLVAEKYRYMVTERFEDHLGTEDENFEVFPARFANIYTVRQLVQLFERAYGRQTIEHQFVRGRNGGVIDLFRPRVQKQGFESLEYAEADLRRHFAAVRAMFERCDVFIFTLGLTEAWRSRSDGFVYPLAPGVVTDEVDQSNFEFHNFSFNEISDDLLKFCDLIHKVNPSIKLMFTVSPVSLVATYEERHVLVSTVASKSILRAAVDDVSIPRQSRGL